MSMIPRSSQQPPAQVDPEPRQSVMESSPGRLLGLKAARPHVEPGATCPTAAPMAQRLFHVLVGVTGSVAALKLPLLVSRLMDIPGLEVAVVTTERAKHFYSPQDIPVNLYSDADEWEMWRHRSDPVLHIDLRRWADLMLVAPLDANTLGKVASGICDNLLTCVIRAWDCRKPLLFCPAMNTTMWEHPITSQQKRKENLRCYHLPLNKEPWSQILVIDRLFTLRPSWCNQIFYKTQGHLTRWWRSG
ncbi:phosphopantothenoylcysteine decarboxylase isoform X2 [Saccopteryx leptura]|uniref:phosphopantothenoylcysteine decarboxylase isoform X2 n=1 Tax=Saccopteryx leptura TaxID=249018 RepID=UPI00339C9BCE